MSNLKNILLLNFAVLCIATSGPLGRAIALPAVLVIFWRTLLAAGVFFGILTGQGRSRQIEHPRDRRVVLGGGVLLALHWVTYFVALQLSSIAIGMLSLFTYPVLTAVLEPLLLKTRFRAAHLLLGALTLLGIYFLVPSFDPADTQLQAVGWGTLSALLYALRNILMKPQVARYSGTVLMYYQMLAACVVLSPSLLWWGTDGIATAWPYLLLLALVTTGLGHTLFLNSFRHFSITTASIMSCVQPVYGILLGMIFLGEYPGRSTYVGGAVILLAVAMESWRSSREQV